MLYKYSKGEKRGKPAPCLLCKKWYFQLSTHVSDNHHTAKQEMKNLIMQGKENRDQTLYQMARCWTKRSQPYFPLSKYKDIKLWKMIVMKKRFRVKWEVATQFKYNYRCIEDCFVDFDTWSTRYDGKEKDVSLASELKRVWVMVDRKMSLYPKFIR